MRFLFGATVNDLAAASFFLLRSSATQLFTGYEYYWTKLVGALLLAIDDQCQVDGTRLATSVGAQA